MFVILALGFNFRSKEKPRFSRKYEKRGFDI